MHPLLSVVTVLTAGLLIGQVDGMVCHYGQERDPDRKGKLRWILPSKDHENRCSCTQIQPGGVNPTLANLKRTDGAEFTDRPLFTADEEEIREYFICADPVQSTLHWTTGDTLATQSLTEKDISVQTDTNSQQTTTTDPSTTTTEPPARTTDSPTTTTEPPVTTTKPPTTTSKPPTTTTNPPATTTDPPTKITELPTTTTEPPTTTTKIPPTTTEPPTTATDSPTTTIEPMYVDCQALLDAGHTVSGAYNITPAQYPDGLEVFCNMTTDSEGWIVFQRRVDGAVDFIRSWAEYRDGFGDKEGEFWLGNEILRRLTEPVDGEQGWQMRVDLETKSVKESGVYDDFHVGEENYTLHVGAFTDFNDMVDSLSPDTEPPYNGQPFSTYDRDNDAEPYLNCADDLKGGWWFNRCTPTDPQDGRNARHYSNLNGEYSETPNYQVYDRGIAWSYVGEKITRSEMKMRRF